MVKRYAGDILAVLAVALVAFGVFLIYKPLAPIVAGLYLMRLALTLERGKIGNPN